MKIKKNQPVICKGKKAYIRKIGKTHVSIVIEGGNILSNGELASIPRHKFFDAVRSGLVVLDLPQTEGDTCIHCNGVGRLDCCDDLSCEKCNGLFTRLCDKC